MFWSIKHLHHVGLEGDSEKFVAAPLLGTTVVVSIDSGQLQ